MYPVTINRKFTIHRNGRFEHRNSIHRNGRCKYETLIKSTIDRVKIIQNKDEESFNTNIF